MNLIHKIKYAAWKRHSDDAGAGQADDELLPPDTDQSADNGVFLNSLDELSEDDISLNEAAQRSAKASPAEILRRLMFWTCLIIFIISCFSLVQNLIAKQRAAEIYTKLEEEFFNSQGFTFDLANAFRPDEGEVKYLAEDTESPVTIDMTTAMNSAESSELSEITATTPEKKQYNEELEKMRAGLASLAQINPDIYGWITIEGTEINYPLVQGEDNDYYLDHAYTGDFLPVGSIFVDYRCDESITKNFNTVIYGHNITSGAMFHDVTKFFRDSYFNDTKIYIYTMDGVFVYEPFSVYETRYDYNYFRTGFRSADDFISFAEEMRDNSQKKKDVSFTENDRIITLSTCTNGAYYARYALHAKLIKTILD